MVFVRDENITPQLEKEVKGATFIFNINLYLVTFNSKGVLTMKIMTFKKGYAWPK